MMKNITVSDIAQILDGYTPINAYMIATSICLLVVSIYLLSRKKSNSTFFPVFAMFSSLFFVVSILVNVSRSFSNNYTKLRAANIYEVFSKYPTSVRIYQIQYWQGGNEMVITVNIDSENKIVDEVFGVKIKQTVNPPFERVTVDELKRLQTLIKEKEYGIYLDVMSSFGK